MIIIKKLFYNIKNKYLLKNSKKSNIYNSEIFRSGLINILTDYRNLLLLDTTQKSSHIIKEIDFHINIINDASKEYFN